MNINIPPDSREWLFAEKDEDSCCLWSLGRFRPVADVGGELIFRFDRQPVAIAVVMAVYPPGQKDCISHHGIRSLRGWKVIWSQLQFVDIRPFKAFSMAIRLRDRHPQSINVIDDLFNVLRWRGHHEAEAVLKLFQRNVELEVELNEIEGSLFRAHT